MRILKYKGICFDDFTKDDTSSMWSQICCGCLQKYSDKLPTALLDECGEGICGVRGCLSDAHYYIDFPAASYYFADTEANDIDDDEDEGDEYDNG